MRENKDDEVFEEFKQGKGIWADHPLVVGGQNTKMSKSDFLMGNNQKYIKNIKSSNGYMLKIANFVRLSVDNNLLELINFKKNIQEQAKRDVKEIESFVNLIKSVKDIVSKNKFVIVSTETELRYGIYKMNIEPYDEKNFNMHDYKFSDEVEMLPSVYIDYNKQFPWTITIVSNLEKIIDRNKHIPIYN